MPQVENVGQTNSVYAGLFYAILKKKYLKMKNNIQKIISKSLLLLFRTHLFL
jgi:hypothetical protein